MKKVAMHPVFYISFLCIALAMGIANADITTGLVGLWTFDEGEGTAAEDSSGNDNHGTLMNGPQWVAGQIGGALEFDGTDDFVEVPHAASLTVDTEVTVAAWINTSRHNSAGGDWQAILAKSNDPRSYSFYTTVGAILHFSTTSGGAYVGSTSTGTVPLNEWVHVAAMVVDGDHRYYINGEPAGEYVADISLPGAADTATVRIGLTQEGGNHFLGMIDEVRIYNRALSDEDITELYNWVGGANAGDDQRVEAGTEVTLTGTGPADATSFTWQQIIVGDEPAVTISDPNSATTTFTPPVRTIGYILTFRLTVDSPETGITTDECLVTVTAPNAPLLVPGNFRTYPGHLSFRLEWDSLVDADEYGVGFKLGPGMYFWFWTDNTYYDLLNLTEGQATVVAVKARNTYGEGPISDDITLVPMKNYALPASLAGTKPPSDYVYVVSHFTIADMNNKVIEDDTNDSWNGLYKEEDYWGYLWAENIYIDHVTYFTGEMFGDGGWFLDLKVQYTKDGTTWINVPTAIRPDYDFTDQRSGKLRYTRYDMDTPTLRGMGVRVYGTPGGTATFTSIAEMQVFADMKTSRPLVVQGVDGQVPERGTGTIDASFSFSTRGDITSMIYEQISGPSVTITITGNPLIATFQAPGVDADTDLVFRITGGDGTETLSDEEVTIVVKNLVTTAVAGPDQGVLEGSAVTLDGSGSLSTTGTLTYQWTQTSGDPVTLNNANAAIADFQAPVIWDYTAALTFRLDVNDGASGTSSDETVVTVQNALAYQAWPYTDAAAANTGYMTDVLHLGTNPTDRILGPLNIDADQLAKWGGEVNVRPVPGEEYDFSDTGVTVTRNPMVWTPIHSNDGWFGNESLDNFQQYYHVNIISPDERAARLHARYDDEVRIWNNGALIYSDNSWDLGSEHQADVTLYEGLNSMTFKFEEGGGGNQIAVGFTDEFDSLMPDVWCSLGPSFVLADAYAVRELPTSYQAGGNVDVTLSVRVNPDNKPSSVTVSEPIPGGLTVVDAGGGTVIGGSLNWTFSGGSVATQVLSYTLGVPAGATGSLNFTGTVSFPTADSIKGDKVIYEIPSAPQNLDIEMLLAANLSWNANPEEGVTGYRVYRNVNGQGWEEAAFVSGNSYKDLDVVEGSSYNYQVAAVNAGGVEGPLSAESGGKSIKMLVRQAEDFNYGGGLYPGPGPDNVPAVEAPALDDFGAGYDFFFQDTTYPSPNVYRPKDDVDVREINPGQFIIGYTSVGDWWRYTFDVPAPGASDPVGGWVQIVLKVASPGGGAVDLYWDEALVGSVPFVTGSWGNFDTYVVEDPLQTTVGTHTLRVIKTAGEMDIDTIGMGFNWTKPTREDLFADDFETYTTLYSFADLVAAGYTVNNGSGVANGAWRLWNTGGNLLGNEDPAIAAMTSNYVITDSDLAGSVDADEELITPNIDCTSHRRVRLDFNMNYRAYPDDTEHDQIAEVDIRSSDDGVTWSDWVTLLRWDTSTVADIASGLEQVDVSAYADSKIIQVRWHFYEANFDYWFAVDDIRVSGDALPPQGGDILTIGYVAGVANLTWNAFGGGNYTVEFTEDLTSGNWGPVPVPGQTWPITDTFWSGDIDDIFDTGAYLRIRSE